MVSQRRDEPVQVKKGTTGPSRRASTQESAAAKPAREDLDARQERIREKRRSGPPLPPPKESPARAETGANVPPTECDDEGEQ
jgi:hypothetical protein